MLSLLKRNSGGASQLACATAICGQEVNAFAYLAFLTSYLFYGFTKKQGGGSSVNVNVVVKHME
jgi:hypothetical protein